MKCLRFLICLFKVFQLISCFKRGIPRRYSLLQINTDVTTIKNSDNSIRIVRKNKLENQDNTDKNAMNFILALSCVEGEKASTGQMLSLTSRILQKTNGPVPRSYLPALMIIDEIGIGSGMDRLLDSMSVFKLIEEGMQWYLDSGGRVTNIEISCPKSLATTIESMGFISAQHTIEEDVVRLRSLDVQEGDNRVILSCDSLRFKNHCEKRILDNQNTNQNSNQNINQSINKYSLYDIIGRLLHDLGDPQGAIKSYTSALQISPKSAVTFRNMGSAYHAIGMGGGVWVFLLIGSL